jgi:hypothetical protein
VVVMRDEFRDAMVVMAAIVLCVVVALIAGRV